MPIDMVTAITRSAKSTETSQRPIPGQPGRTSLTVMFMKHDTTDIKSPGSGPGGLSAGSAALCGSGRAPGAAPGTGLGGLLLCDSDPLCHADPGLASPGFRASLVGPGWLSDGSPGRAAVLACTCFAGSDSRTGP